MKNPSTAREFVNRLMDDAQDIPTEYTIEDARTDLRNFRAESWELPEDITDESLFEAMNEWVDEYRALNAE